MINIKPQWEGISITLLFTSNTFYMPPQPQPHTISTKTIPPLLIPPLPQHMQITVLPASIQIKRATMAQAEVSSERVFGDIDDISRQIIRVVGDEIVSRVELLIVPDNRSDRGK